MEKGGARPQDPVMPAQTQRFSNHEWDHVKTSVETDDSNQALSDGYEILMQDPRGVYVVLRKMKVKSCLAEQLP